MAISEQDREWIKAIVSEAATQAMLQYRDTLYGAIEKHSESCALKWQGRSKAFMAGMVFAVALTGGGVAVGLAKLLRVLQ